MAESFAGSAIQPTGSLSVSDYNEPGMGCPFDYRLARTSFLVLPKLALQSMPMPFRRKFEALLQEMDDAGISTPRYFVLRDERPYAWAVLEDPEDEFSRIERVENYLADPWANYRHGRIEELCPKYVRPVVHAPEPVKRRPSSSHVWVPGWDGEFGYFRDAIGQKVVCTVRGYEDRHGVVRKYSMAHDTFGIDEFPDDEEEDTGLLWMKRGSFKFDGD
jgi:hypothetical protein